MLLELLEMLQGAGYFIAKAVELIDAALHRELTMGGGADCEGEEEGGLEHSSEGRSGNRHIHTPLDIWEGRERRRRGRKEGER